MKEKLILKAWHSTRLLTLPLWPLSWIMKILVKLRRQRFLKNRATLWHSATPIVVVGNVTVGGTGKTPLLITLTKAFEARGLRVGIISRGYGGKAPFYPFSVTSASDPAQAGDEPVLLARSTGCPVVVDPRRVQAAQALVERQVCDVILSDDGLQHYALERDIEIAVIDAQRGLGNGLCLPAGPMREPPERLNEVDFVVINGAENPIESFYKKRVYPMQILPQSWVNMETLASVEYKPAEKVHAVAGIGNPQRFYDTLQSLGIEVVEHSFPDHHYFSPKDFIFKEDLPVVMTEKDAVKCQFEVKNAWYLKVAASIDDDFVDALVDVVRLRAIERQSVEKSNLP